MSASISPPPHPTLGRPERVWGYVQADGTPFCYVARWDPPGRRKEIRPFHVNGAGVEWTRPEGLAPLYGLPELLSGGGRALVVGGEKTRDAAKKLFPGWTVTTNLGGENAEAKTDWTPVRAKHVTIWPDADDTGRRWAERVARLCLQAGAASVHIVDVPLSAPAGWDVADEIPAGWRLEEILESACEYRSDAFRDSGEGAWSDGSEAPEFSEEALALAFAREHADDLRHCDGFGRWYLWDRRWVVDEKRNVFTMARTLCRAQAERALRTIPKETAARNEAKRLASRSTVASVVDLARCDACLAVASHAFDPDPTVFNTLEGTA